MFLKPLVFSAAVSKFSLPSALETTDPVEEGAKPKCFSTLTVCWGFLILSCKSEQLKSARGPQTTACVLQHSLWTGGITVAGQAARS